jgi:nucleosome binding factor SPN SPT16 subunit
MLVRRHRILKNLKAKPPNFNVEGSFSGAGTEAEDEEDDDIDYLYDYDESDEPRKLKKMA